MSMRHFGRVQCAALILLTACSNGSSSRDSVRATEPVSTHAAAAGASQPADVPLAAMRQAKPVGKIGVPVDVRYQVVGVLADGQPATMQLAVVPRVAGENLRVEFPETPGVVLDVGTTATWAEKATASDVFRRTLQVTPTSASRSEMRAIVSMDVNGSRFFSVFAMPLEDPAPTGSKR